MLVSGTFSEVALAVKKLQAAFEVLQTAYFVSEDETVQVYICVKLLSADLANPTIDILSQDY